MRPVLKIRGIIFKSLCLPNPVTSSESDSNTSLCAHFSLYNPVLSCRSSEEHYYIVKYTNIDLFSPWELTWEGLSVCVCVCVWRGIDWCLVCWSMTIHIKVDTPSEHVSTSVRHVSAQEFRQCRETFYSTNKTFLCPNNAPFNLNLFW